MPNVPTLVLPRRIWQGLEEGDKTRDSHMNHHPHNKDDDGPWVALFIAAVIVAVFISILKIATK